MDFANIKEAADPKQEASTEELTSLVFQVGFAMDIASECCPYETHTPCPTWACSCCGVTDSPRPLRVPVGGDVVSDFWPFTLRCLFASIKTHKGWYATTSHSDVDLGTRLS